MVRYSTFEDFQSAHPEVAELVVAENRAQHPTAKFMVAVTGKTHPENAHLEAQLAFDCGTPGKLLWVTADAEDPYLDEYYEASTQDVMGQIALVQ